MTTDSPDHHAARDPYPGTAWPRPAGKRTDDDTRPESPLVPGVTAPGRRVGDTLAALS